MSILVLDGHPNPASLGAAIAQRYAEASGAQLVAIRDLAFDPVLHKGLTAEQALEPDLLRVRELIERATHVVVTTPMWWSGVPAPLKALIDRVFTQGWAYRYERGLPVRLLKGRSARIIMTADSPRWYLMLAGNPVVAMLKRGTLAFSGFSPVRTTVFHAVRSSTPLQRDAWLDTVARIGAKDARATSGAVQPEVVLAR